MRSEANYHEEEVGHNVHQVEIDLHSVQIVFLALFGGRTYMYSSLVLVLVCRVSCVTLQLQHSTVDYVFLSIFCFPISIYLVSAHHDCTSQIFTFMGSPTTCGPLRSAVAGSLQGSH